MIKTPSCNTCIFKSEATKFLSDDEIVQLEKNCASAEFDKGETIFKQGTFSKSVVYLKDGIVKLLPEGPRKNQITAIKKGPDYLGIPTAFDEKHYRYSAVSISKISACFIDIELFKQFVIKNGLFAFRIIINLCKDNLDVFEKCVNKSQKNARGRIAEALLFFKEEIYNSESFILPLTRKELGNYTDTARECVSRILSEFDKDRIIKVAGRKIKIINSKALELIKKTG